MSECILRVRLRWVVAPCHSPRLLAYAHLFPFQQELTSGLWAAYSASRCYSREDSPALYRSTLRIACLHSTIAVFVPLLHCLSNLVYIIDNQLTWQRILPEKLVVPHLIKKFRAFKVKKKRGCPSARHVGSSKNGGITPLILILGNILSGQLYAKGAFPGKVPLAIE